MGELIMYLKRIITLTMLFLLANIVIIYNLVTMNIIVKISLFLILVSFFVKFNIFPRDDKVPSLKMKNLINGYELFLVAHILIYLELIFYLFLYFKTDLSLLPLLSNFLVFILVLACLLINGFLKIVISSRQISLFLKLSLLFLWWCPIINIILFKKWRTLTKDEFDFSLKRYQLNTKRKNEKITQTKYPLLMIHGIFFRDWKLFNYWGRIPTELINNGATVFYASQQSSLSVEQSAQEIKTQILEIIKKTNTTKVNIIAHSKGGMDARYAISCLGMQDYVASLTTINTPHYGSDLADKLIEISPDKFILSVGKKYDSLFSKLGDKQPDFLSGIHELTEEKCQLLNEMMPDNSKVFYQSVASKMNNASSAPFPLNLGYRIIKAKGKENDGLVAIDSMRWGHFLGVITPTGKKGISHGDMIDLTRKNIKDFDVCEYYVQLVSNLKNKGF